MEEELTYEEDFDKEEELKENSKLAKQVMSNQQKSQLYTQSDKEEVKGSVKMFMTDEDSSIGLNRS